jgi:hypothetical protein
MWACRYLSMAVLAGLSLQTPLQAQQCDSRNGQAAFHLGWPYTVEYHDKNGRIGADGKPAPDQEDVTLVAEDSQGRVLYRWTSTDGRFSARIYDPVAAQEIWWSTDSTKVKIVKYATPVAGRRSCWQSSFSDRYALTGRPLQQTYQAFCAPAGHQGQPAGCYDVCETEHLGKALPPEKQGFPQCENGIGVSGEDRGKIVVPAEDLGILEIQGIPARGCRRTLPRPNQGSVVSENWSDDYGLELRQSQEFSSGLKGSRDLISLSREEPDPSVFQPPKGYEVVTLEMDEVPCKDSPAQIIAVMPSSKQQSSGAPGSVSQNPDSVH